MKRVIVIGAGALRDLRELGDSPAARRLRRQEARP